MHLQQLVKRKILNLSKFNSVSKMFMNLNIPSFDDVYETLCLVLDVEFKTLLTR